MGNNHLYSSDCARLGIAPICTSPLVPGGAGSDLVTSCSQAGTGVPSQIVIGSRACCQSASRHIRQTNHVSCRSSNTSFERQQCLRTRRNALLWLAVDAVWGLPPRVPHAAPAFLHGHMTGRGPTCPTAYPIAHLLQLGTPRCVRR